jgi:hypothetical protein
MRPDRPSMDILQLVRKVILQIPRVGREGGEDVGAVNA